MRLYAPSQNEGIGEDLHEEGKEYRQDLFPGTGDAHVFSRDDGGNTAGTSRSEDIRQGAAARPPTPRRGRETDS